MTFPKWKKSLRSIFGTLDRIAGKSKPVMLALGAMATPTEQAVGQVVVAPTEPLLSPVETSKYSKKYVLQSVRMSPLFTHSAQHRSHASHSSHSSHASHHSGVTSPSAAPLAQPSNTAAVPVRRLAGDFSEAGGQWGLGVLSTGVASSQATTFASQTLGQVEINPRNGLTGLNFSGFLTSESWNLTGMRVSVHVVETARESAETIFALVLDAGNWYRFDERNGMLEFQSSLNGVRSSASVPYDLKAHRSWRLHHDPATGIMIWETSSDGVIWTVRHAVSAEVPVTALRVELSAGTSQPCHQPGKAVFDNFRVNLNQ